MYVHMQRMATAMGQEGAVAMCTRHDCGEWRLGTVQYGAQLDDYYGTTVWRICGALPRLVSSVQAVLF